MTAVVAPHLGGHQPLHPAAQVTIPPRPQHQVNVVRHETVGEHTHGQALAGLDHQFDKGAVVRLVLKYADASIATIDDVVADATGGGTGGSWHEADLQSFGRPGASVTKPVSTSKN